MKVNLYQYFGFLENVSYTYHCPGKYPVVDTIKNAAIYVITVDVDCYFNPSEDVIDEFRDKSSMLHVPVLQLKRMKQIEQERDVLLQSHSILNSKGQVDTCPGN